ncbi:MAG: hypothetical protein P1P64_05485 [Treponemataceae bacterium]
MSKAHRGKGVREEFNRGRGTCPSCKRTGVKVVYEHETDGEKLKICKICKATNENKKRREARATKPATPETEATETADATETAE